MKEVLQAYEIMRQVARNIDQVKRKLEQQIRVKELSGILDGWLGPGELKGGDVHYHIYKVSEKKLVFFFLIIKFC